MSKFKKILIISSVLLVSACGGNSESGSTSSTVQGGGSSAMGTFQKTCSAVYPDHTINYTASSSGTGRTAFASGEVDFGGSDDPVKENDPQRPVFGHIPVIGAPIVIAYNVAGLTSLKLDTIALGLIWQGKILKWNDSIIQELNPGKKLPDKNIVVAYRSSSSGTSGNFSGYLTANNAEGWSRNSTITTANGVGDPAGGLGFTSGGQLVTAVKTTEFSIGYADLADWTAQNVKTFAAIKNPNGDFVIPSTSTASKFIDENTDIDANGVVKLQWDKAIAGAYNIVLVSYILVPDKSNYETESGENISEVKAAAVEDYANYLLDSCGPKQGPKLGYVPISGEILTQAKSIAEQIS